MLKESKYAKEILFQNNREWALIAPTYFPLFFGEISKRRGDFKYRAK